jgi:hypothetical protein
MTRCKRLITILSTSVLFLITEAAYAFTIFDSTLAGVKIGQSPSSVLRANKGELQKGEKVSFFSFSNAYRKVEIGFPTIERGSKVKFISCKFNPEYKKYLDWYIPIVKANNELPEYKKDRTLRSLEEIQSELSNTNCNYKNVSLYSEESIVISQGGKRGFAKNVDGPNHRNYTINEIENNVVISITLTRDNYLSEFLVTTIVVRDKDFDTLADGITVIIPDRPNSNLKKQIYH